MSPWRAKATKPLFVAVLLLLGALGVWYWQHMFAGPALDAVQWRAVGANIDCANTQRFEMADDVVAHRLRAGMTAGEVRALLGPPSGTQKFPDRNAEIDARWQVNHSASLGETRQETEDRLRNERRKAFGISRPPTRGFFWYYNIGQFDTTCFSVLARFERGRVVWASRPF